PPPLRVSSYKARDTHHEDTTFPPSTFTLFTISTVFQGAHPGRLARSLVPARDERQLRCGDYRWRPPRSGHRLLSGEKSRHHEHRGDRKRLYRRRRFRPKHLNSAFQLPDPRWRALLRPLAKTL